MVKTEVETPPKQVSTENSIFALFGESINYFRTRSGFNQASVSNLKSCPLTWCWLLALSNLLCK